MLRYKQHPKFVFVLFSAFLDSLSSVIPKTVEYSISKMMALLSNLLGTEKVFRNSWVSQEPKEPHRDISVCWHGSAGVPSHLPRLQLCRLVGHCRRTSQKVPGGQDGCISNRNSMAVRLLLRFKFRNRFDGLKLPQAGRASFPIALPGELLNVLGEAPPTITTREQNVNICLHLPSPRGKSFSCCCILDFTICFFCV